MKCRHINEQGRQECAEQAAIAIVTEMQPLLCMGTQGGTHRTETHTFLDFHPLCDAHAWVDVPDVRNSLNEDEYALVSLAHNEDEYHMAEHPVGVRKLSHVEGGLS